MDDMTEITRSYEKILENRVSQDLVIKAAEEIMDILREKTRMLGIINNNKMSVLEIMMFSGAVVSLIKEGLVEGLSKVDNPPPKEVLIDLVEVFTAVDKSPRHKNTN